MLYTTFTVKDKEYKARLTAKACVDLEKKLGTNPLNVFMGMMSSETVVLPKMEVMITILHASLQAYEHGVTIEKVYEIYDAFVDEGKTLMDLVPILIDIFKVSGFLPEEAEEATIKNA